MYFQKHLQLFLIFLCIPTAQCDDPKDQVARTLSDIYSKLDPNTPTEVKNRFETFHPISAGEKCSVGMFNDSRNAYSTPYYCYAMLELPDINNRKRVIATNQYSNIIPCESNNDCYDQIGIDANCDLNTGHKYANNDRILKNGICIQVDTFAYVFMETIKAIPHATLVSTGRVFQPVLYDPDFKINVPNCRDDGKGCGIGQFCSAVVGFPEDLPGPNATYFCYFLPKLPDRNIGHKIAALLPNQDLALCRSDPECANESDEAWNCDLSTRQVFARVVNGKRVIYKGLCVRTPPISVSYADRYINLDFDTTYLQRLQYFPVDFERLSQDKPLKKCDIDSECKEGEFCGEVYDYATKSAKNGVKYCFKSIIFPEESSSGTWIIVLIVVIVLIVIVALIAAGLTIWKLKMNKKDKKLTKKEKKDKKGKGKGKTKTKTKTKNKKKPKKINTSTTVMKKEWADVSII